MDTDTDTLFCGPKQQHVPPHSSSQRRIACASTHLCCLTVCASILAWPHLKQDSPQAEFARSCALDLASRARDASRQATIHTSGGRYPNRASPYTNVDSCDGLQPNSLACAALQKLSSHSSPGFTRVCAKPQISLLSSRVLQAYRSSWRPAAAAVSS